MKTRTGSRCRAPIMPGRLASVVAVIAAGVTLLVGTARASLPFSVSYPRQCTTLNVTFTPQQNAFPYTVYILSVGAMVESYRINSDYQSSNQFTFQWQVPKISSIFSTFVVAITDSQGNGNSTDVLAVDSTGPSSCQPYAATSAFTFAGDSTSGNDADRTQCGNVHYYAVDAPFRGTAPYSISLVPLQGTPVTVNIPSSATKNSSYFDYTSKVPFKSGTQFYTFLSDATGGGSGGGSPIYTVAPSSDSSCVNNDISNQDSKHTLPEGETTAHFQNLSGAISSNTHNGTAGSNGSSGSSGSSGKTSNVGGLVGGIIGAVIGVCGILLLVALFVLYRRRQRRKAELERKEQPQFIDLDDDDDEAHGTSMTASNAPNSLGRQAGRQRRSRVGSFAVSPFTYEPSQQDPPLTHEVMTTNEHGRRVESDQSYTHSGSTNSALLAGLGAGAAGGALSANSGHGSDGDAPYSALYNNNAHGFHSSTSPYLAPPITGGAMYPRAYQGAEDVYRRPSTTAHGTDSELVSVYSGGGAGYGQGMPSGPHRPASIVSGSGNGVSSSPRSSGYVLRARNDDEAIRRGSNSGLESGAGAQAPTLPQKGELYPGSRAEEDDHDGSRTAARVMQHTDAGGVEEVPPSYGQWNKVRDTQ